LRRYAGDSGAYILYAVADGKEKRCAVRDNAVAAKLPGYDHQLRLVAVKTPALSDEHGDALSFMFTPGIRHGKL